MPATCPGDASSLLASSAAVPTNRRGRPWMLAATRHGAFISSSERRAGAGGVGMGGSWSVDASLGEENCHFFLLCAAALLGLRFGDVPDGGGGQCTVVTWVYLHGSSKRGRR